MSPAKSANRGVTGWLPPAWAPIRRRQRRYCWNADL